MCKAKGSPKTAGRKKGTPNIMTRELKEMCRQEAPTLVKELIRLATSAEGRLSSWDGCRGWVQLDQIGRKPYFWGFFADCGGQDIR